MQTPTFIPFGESAILVTWHAVIQRDIHEEVVCFDQLISERFAEEILETVVTYQSLAVYLNQGTDVKAFGKALKSAYETLASKEHSRNSHLITIPVCYEGDFAHDIEYVATVNNLSIEEAIQVHSETIYKVYFLGFLPGFPYLGELDERLHCPRKQNPERVVRKGSVGIGGKQTGIYSMDSPGGWHVIGKSPLVFFDAEKNPAALISAGDYVTFKPISKQQFHDLEDLVGNGLFVPDKIPYHD